MVFANVFKLGCTSMCIKMVRHKKTPFVLQILINIQSKIIFRLDQKLNICNRWE